jgi:hypothetical protein
VTSISYWKFFACSVRLQDIRPTFKRVVWFPSDVTSSICGTPGNRVASSNSILTPAQQRFMNQVTKKIGRWLSGRLGMAQRCTRAVRGGRRFDAWSKGVRRRGSRGARQEQSGVGGVRRLSREKERWLLLVTTACVTRGADVAVGQRRCEVVAAATQLSRTLDASVRASFKQRLRLASGPGNFFI